MKTLLAIVLAAAVTLMFGATVTPISSTAVAGGGGPDKWCGAAVCPPKHIPSGSYQTPSGSYQTPGQYRGPR
jgi:hypothetical protein